MARWQPAPSHPAPVRPRRGLICVQTYAVDGGGVVVLGATSVRLARFGGYCFGLFCESGVSELFPVGGGRWFLRGT